MSHKYGIEHEPAETISMDQTQAMPPKVQVIRCDECRAVLHVGWEPISDGDRLMHVDWHRKLRQAANDQRSMNALVIDALRKQQEAS